MDTFNDTLKQCSKKDQCLHPEADEDGWLPATTEYFILHKGKLYCQCHYCRRDAKRKSHTRNAEHNNTRCHNWYIANREEELDKRKKQNALNPQPARNRVKAWKKANPVKRKAARQRYNKKHPDKIRLRSRVHQNLKRQSDRGTFTADDLALQYKSQRGLCWHCGKPVGDTWHADHLIPLVRGGSNAPENIVISCPQCNYSKGAKLPQEWNGRLL